MNHFGLYPSFANDWRSKVKWSVAWFSLSCGPKKCFGHPLVWQWNISFCFFSRPDLISIGLSLEFGPCLQVFYHCGALALARLFGALPIPRQRDAAPAPEPQKTTCFDRDNPPNADRFRRINKNRFSYVTGLLLTTLGWWNDHFWPMFFECSPRANLAGKQLANSLCGQNCDVSESRNIT